MARDWFRDQVKALGCQWYKVNATGSQFAFFEGEDNSIPPIAMGSHLDSVATGGKFDGPLGVSSHSNPKKKQRKKHESYKHHDE